MSSDRPGRLLIVNADDYGLTPGVSAGIVRAVEQGIVSSTSVLAVAPAVEETAPWLVGRDDVGVGVHLAVVGEDPPLLSAAEIPTLVDRRGHLAASWKVLLPRLARRAVDPADLRREMAAQVARVRSLGLRPGHLDTHQHVHLWPSVGLVVCDLAVELGIPAVRVPRSAAGPKGRAIGVLAQRLAARARRAGLRTPAWAAGLDEAGGVDEAVLTATLRALAARGAASAELNVHPGEVDDPARARYRWDYAWTDELAALTSPRTRQLVRDLGFGLGTYADLDPTA